MRSIAIIGVAGIMLAGICGSALAQGMLPSDVKFSNGMLTDAKGMTLYTYDNDKTPGKSSCTDTCSQNWPALVATADAKPMGNWTVLMRDDGTKQWALKGKPLYTFAHDAKAGDMSGDGRGKVWHMAMP